MRPKSLYKRTICYSVYSKLKNTKDFDSITNTNFSLQLNFYGVKPETATRYLRTFKAIDRAKQNLTDLNRA